MVGQLIQNLVWIFPNGITMCVQNQWEFLKVEILNGLSVGGLNMYGLNDSLLILTTYFQSFPIN